MLVSTDFQSNRGRLCPVKCSVSHLSMQTVAQMLLQGSHTVCSGACGLALRAPELAPVLRASNSLRKKGELRHVYLRVDQACAWPTMAPATAIASIMHVLRSTW